MKKTIKKAGFILPAVISGAFVMAFIAIFLFVPQVSEAKAKYQSNWWEVKSYNDASYTTEDSDFNQGETVYGKGASNKRGQYRLRFYDPDGNLTKTCGLVKYKKVSKCSYDLPLDAKPGTWKIEFQKGNFCIPDLGCIWNEKATDTFNVTPAPVCGDGIVNGEEECDPQAEPNYPSGFYCTDECTVVKRPTAEVFAAKIVCDSEEDLPNWGGVPGDQFIDENTARDYVTNSEGKCHLTKWDFQYKTGNAANPGDNTGEAVSWTTFSSSATVDILDSNLIKIREVMDDKYIPFTGANHTENVSAEIYCANDNFNYDNFDYITNAQNGEKYYCVAWNVINYGSIQGRKYYDVNKNGHFDEEEKNEPGDPNRLDGWNIYLFDKDWQKVQEMATGDDTTSAGNVGKGQYRFVDVIPGDYYVCEENRTSGSWLQSEPDSGPMYDGLYCHEVTVNPGQDVKGVQFGNYQSFNIRGFKWNDLNGNGKYDCEKPIETLVKNGIDIRPVPDSCEPKLSDWTIFIDQNKNGILDNKEQSAVTDEDGNYEFSGLPAGTYTVCEVQQAGWTQTFPAGADCYQITLPTLQPDSFSLSSSKNFVQRPLYNFGNFELASLKGKKCEDPNGNGDFLPAHGENDCIPLEGWTIYIDMNKNGQLDDGEPQDMTDVKGRYYFDHLLMPNTVYQVREVMQNGWIQTRPQITFGRDYHKVNVKESGKTYWRNFGNYQAQCGNNILDQGEECDGPGGEIPVGQYCSEACTLEPYYTLSKTDNKDTAQPGDSSTYEINFGYTQEDYSLIMGGLIVDTLPDNFTVDETTISDSGSYNPSDGTITWDLDEVGGAAHTFTFSGTISSDMPEGTTILTNVARLYQGLMQDPVKSFTVAISNGNTGNNNVLLLTATDETSVTVKPTVKEYCGDGIKNGDEECDGSDGVTGGQTCSDTCTIEPTNETNTQGEVLTAVLSIIKSVDKTTANPGDVLTYTVTISNSSENDALNVVLTDTLPAGLTFANADGSNSGETEKTWTWDTIAGTKDQTVTFKALVDSKAGEGKYTNTAKVTADNSDSAKASASTDVVIPKVLGEETPVLEISKTADVAWVNPSGKVTYTVTITNTGNTPAYNAKLEDVLPKGFIYAGTKDQTTAEWKLGDIVPTEIKTVKYQAVALSNAEAGNYTNTATVSADDIEGVSAKATVEVRKVAVLGAEDEVTELPVTGGSVWQYIFVIAAGFTLLFAGYMLKLTFSKKKF